MLLWYPLSCMLIIYGTNFKKEIMLVGVKVRIFGVEIFWICAKVVCGAFTTAYSELQRVTR